MVYMIKKYFMELIRQQTKYIDNGQISFLVYITGSGGEYLGECLQEYSNDEYITTTKSVYLSEYNKTVTSKLLGNFFCNSLLYADITHNMISSPLNEASKYDVIYRVLEKSLDDKDIGFKIEVISDQLDQLENGKKAIVKSHIYIPEYMKGKSYLINPDTDHYFDHTMKNVECKVNRQIISTLKDLTNEFGGYSKLPTLIELMKSSNMSSIEYGHAIHVLKAFDEKDMKSRLLYNNIHQDYKKLMYSTYQSRLTNLRSMIPEDRYINMSELYDGGKSQRIKSMFNINGTNFDSKCLEWYNKNLELHKKYELW